MPLIPEEQLAHSTVRIECDLLAGGVATGTGFFFTVHRSEGQRVPVIVTNKHVVEDSSKGRFILTLQDPNGEPLVGSNHAFELDNFYNRWIPHPDHDVDLCVMPITPLIQAAEQRGLRFFFASMDKTLIPSKTDIADMVGLESITMVGYPNGLWDEVNNLPIFRKGILASDYKYDWNGKKEFLIDVACFPGSSGSPVMLYDIGSFHNRKGTHIASSRIKLLGVLYAGPQHTVEGEIHIGMVPTQEKAVAFSQIPNNLGIVIKAEQLLAF